jgi:CRISPR-associated protein Csm3
MLGKFVIKGIIEVKTGLRIGGSTTGLKIGGVDLNVITDPEGKPYIPGSSLKGKMRSLMEHKFNKVREDGKAHYCTNDEDYKNCPICKIWGISPTEKDMNINIPIHTRMLVRDIPLDESSVKNFKLELQYTEIKVENVINRKKGCAESPRQIERVPAGAKFGSTNGEPIEMIIYTVYENDDIDIFKYVFEAMELLEHDYLGGMGSRGYGKVEFKNIKIYWNKKEDYESGKLNVEKINDSYDTPSKIVENFKNIFEKIKATLK